MALADDDPLPFWFGEEGAGATAEQLASAELYVGHALPEALRSLLMQRNGGISNYAAYENGNAEYSVLPFFGVDPDAAVGTLMRAHDVRHAFGVPDGVVVFAGMGNAWWGLDYRSTLERPSILFSGDAGEQIDTVAVDFDEFMRGLTED